MVIWKLTCRVQCYWEFPDSISRVSCCHDLNSAVGAFVLTVDGTLWKVDWAEKWLDKFACCVQTLLFLGINTSLSIQ
jgi:hypothetical protein